ncbi:MAG TPA: metallophosphoesterase family protein [Candidatus Binatia bacterium]|nr:metallophosphoesterase family protein [Candidatus Binatia bacterium]
MAGRFYVVGDIHGCQRELEVLLDGLGLGAGDTLAFIGDYIDRGPDSRAVVDLMLALRARADLTTVFLKGNHEDMCLAYLGRPGLWGEAWKTNGGVSTLRSYGVPTTLAGPAAADRFPPDHLAFFENLRMTHLDGDYLLVHAGIRPSRTLAEQDAEDLLWIREEFIASPHSLPHTVVFGHTPQRRVLVDLPFKIGIDTGCVYGGCLTALEPRERMLHQVTYGERTVRRSELAATSFGRSARG